MKWNRRDLLKSAAAFSASQLSYRSPAYGRSSSHSSNTIFFQGALGGGGFGEEIQVSADGRTAVMHSDVPGAFLWKAETGKWEQLLNSSKLNNPRYGFTSTDCHSIALSRDGKRIYMVAGTLNVPIGSNIHAMPWMTVYRSDDRGASFSATSLTTFSGTSTLVARGLMPKMLVDPVNSDICYVTNSTGVLFVTYNAGVTWHNPDDLWNALPHAAANANSPIHGEPITLHFDSNAITVAVGTVTSGIDAVMAYNRDAPLSIGSNGSQDHVYSANATQVVVAGVEPRTLGGSTSAGSPSVLAGDRIYFGKGALLAIDGSETVANPGIALGDPGASGLASKYIYIGYRAQALTDSLWHSADGGATFGAMLGTVPTQIRNMAMSNDAALAGGGNNILYVADQSTHTPNKKRNAWRYVNTPPNGSGLTANTWTNLNVQMVNPQIGPAPFLGTLGKVCFMDGRGNSTVSVDYGATNVGYHDGPQNINTASDGVGWMGCGGDGFALGSQIADANGLVWIVDGIGCYTMSPTETSAEQTWNTRTAGMDSMIIQRITKAPSPSGKILLACQDRPLFVVDNEKTYPSTYFPVSTSIAQTGDVIYSDSDPTVWYAGKGDGVWRTQDGSTTWVQIGRNGVNGCNLGAGGTGGLCPMLASISPTNVMAAGCGNSPAYVQRGTATGDPNVASNWTWANCTYSGNPVSAKGNSPDYTNNLKHIVSDGNGNYYWFSPYDGMLYKSTDGGATFAFAKTATGVGLHGYTNGIIVCVPGKPGHLFITGGQQASNIAAKLNMYRTTDDGGSWQAITNMFIVWNVHCGKAKPGTNYPAVYVSGAPINDRANPGLFRCDNCPDSGVDLTWTRLTNVTKQTLLSPRAIWADQEIYGKLYFGTAAGYFYGELTT